MFLFVGIFMTSIAVVVGEARFSLLTKKCESHLESLQELLFKIALSLSGDKQKKDDSLSHCQRCCWFHAKPTIVLVSSETP